jgi:SAM-dependent methyltransferase
VSAPLVVEEAGLSDAELREIRAMLARTPGRAPSLAEIWGLMDEAWAALGCDERRPEPARLAAFYRHPVWALNGMFAEQDAVSRGHRLAIAAWLRSLAPARVLDFGGGYGGMARMAAAALPGAAVEVYEPFPSAAALALAAAHPNLRYVAEPGRGYDAALCLDVLEHVPDPLPPLAELAAALRPGGRLAVANNFYPVIRCHLPGTFHLRYTFPLVAGLLGLRREGRIPAALADVYRKAGPPDRPPPWPALRALEAASRAAYPALRAAHRAHRALRRRPHAVV